ncbi:hypothetical protein G3O08_17840 [Cryomorpha ignava]|uniref:Uncharacterized protein n=1 Tax=Cryomorpha ignava TaxID=101383 RepID=A0A7K3WWD8_9FLAO|nr:hypothetical protein [Cryomorpha ignava]NEN25361.1 hypothetical protein [Cryomorpha ignava]
MKEFLQSLFKTTEERIRNPFIGAFMTSWLLFNWKPILYILLSSYAIGNRIEYVEEHFSNYILLFWLPLIAALFYVLVLPYLNLGFDRLLKKSQLKRNLIVIETQKRNIANQIELAIGEIKLEETKTSYRERNSHNQLVEALQKKNRDLEITLDATMEKNNSALEDLKAEFSNREKIRVDEIKSFERNYSESREEIMALNNAMFEKDKQIQNLRKIVSDLERKDSNKTLSYLLEFENGLKLIERFDGNKITYLNPETNEIYSDQKAEILKERSQHSRKML